MKVWYFSPYSVQKNLGKEYNSYMNLIPDEDVACITDQDVMFLTPDAGDIVFNYAYQNPGVVMTCWTNRIHELAKEQRVSSFEDKENIIHHITIAAASKTDLYHTTECTGPLSGFLMLIPKSVWKKYPFKEDGLLGVDTDFYKRYRADGNKVLRMDGLYVWHTYRLGKDIKDTSHLK